MLRCGRAFNPGVIFRGYANLEKGGFRHAGPLGTSHGVTPTIVSSALFRRLTMCYIMVWGSASLIPGGVCNVSGDLWGRPTEVASYPDARNTNAIYLCRS